MKIGINCIFFQRKGGGIKEYIENLLGNLAEIVDEKDELILYVLKDQEEYAKQFLPKKFKIKTVPFLSGSKYNRIKRSLLESKFWRAEEKKEKFDLFHSPVFHAPDLKNTKILITVHDLRLYRFPETYEFFRYQFLKRKVRSSIKRADKIISISDFTKDEIINLCGENPNKIIVIHEAINPEKFTDKNIYEPQEIPEALKDKRFILSVGHIEPRKNYDRLIEVFTNLKQEKEFEDLQLVIVGKPDHGFKAVLEKMKNTPDVHYMNFVDGNTLLWLYKNANLFVFPSYYEGFGFPPLEAASLGTISAVSNVSSIPEVCGDAAFYFNPFDIKEINTVLRKALADESERELIYKKSQKRLKDFSWRQNAVSTYNLYRDMCSGKPLNKTAR